MNIHIALLSAIVLFSTMDSTHVLSAVITTIQPKIGSINGETRVSILGTGFDIRGRSNDIFIGKGGDGVFCDPIPNECHEKRIVCLTPAYNVAGALNLTVRSFGTLSTCGITSGCTFEFSPQKTPLVTRIVPEWIVAPSTVTVFGSRFTNGDPSVGRFDFTMHIADEERCQITEDIKSDSFVCQVEQMYAGSHKLKVIMGDSGKASWQRPTTLTIYPSVNGIRPARGSSEGGQLVTVLGTSFSKELADNEVYLHGQPCIPVELRDEGLVCRTGPAPKNRTNVIPPPPSFQPRTLRRDTWYNMDGDTITNDLVSTLRYDFPSETEFSAGVVKTDTCDRCAFRWTGFFTPNTTGIHRFFVKGDDQTAIWLGKSETPVLYENTGFRDIDPFNEAQIAFSQSYTADYVTFPSQASNNITLQQGSYYWLQVFLKEGYGTEYIEIEVLNPEGKRSRLNVANLAYREPYTPPVRAVVRGLPAKYGAGCLEYGSCYYIYDDAVTPSLVSVSPQSITAGDTLTVTVTRFPDSCLDVSVKIGSAFCDLVSCSATSIVCKVNASTPLSTQNVKAYYDTIGQAQGTLFVTVRSLVSDVSPSKGSTAGGSLIEVKGSNFDVSAINRTTVNVGDKLCAIEKMTTTSIFCRVPQAKDNKTDTLGDIKVTIQPRNQTAKADAFYFTGVYVRPGTSTNDEAPTVRPALGSTMGGTRLTITASAFTKAYVLDDVIIVIGSSVCVTQVSIPGRIECLTAIGSLSSDAQDVKVTFPNSDNDENKNTTTLTIRRAFTYISTIQSVEPKWNDKTRFSPYGSAVLTINGVRIQNTSSVSATLNSRDLVVKAAGGQIFVTIPSQITPIANSARPVLAHYDFSDDTSLGRFDVSALVVLQRDTNAVFIPKGNNWIATKREFKRPFSVQASVQSLGDGCVSLDAFTTDVTSSVSGYSLSVNPAKQTISRGVDSKVTETDRILNLPDITASKTTWRVDFQNELITFYINDVKVDEFFDNTKTAGDIGFGQSCADIIIDDIIVRDLNTTSFQVSVDGAPIPNIGFDVVWDVSAAPTISSLSKNTFVSGEIITVFGTNLHTSDQLRGSNIFLLTANNVTNDLDESTALSLCSDITGVTGDFRGVLCRVSSSLPFTSRKLRLKTKYGLNAPTNAVVVTIRSAIKSVSPATGGSLGTTLTILGSGFPSNVNVQLNNKACDLKTVTTSAIVCNVPAGLPDGKYPLKITSAGIDVPCTFNDCTFTVSNALTPNITRVQPSVATKGDIITISGNFAKLSAAITFGTANCDFQWSDAKTTTCKISGNVAVGKFKIQYQSANGIAIASDDMAVEFKSGIFRVTPNAGSTAGNTPITMFGNGFVDSWQTSGDLQYDFKAGVLQSGWTATTDLRLTTCEVHGSMLGGYGLFGAGASASRTFTLPEHKRLRVTARIMGLDTWDGSESIKIYVDGVLTDTEPRSASCSYALCGSSTQDCFVDIDFFVPHTKSTATITFTSSLDQDAFDESWGLMNYALYFDNTDSQYSVTVGGKPCAITSSDSNSITCLTPSGTDGVNVVEVKKGTDRVSCFPDTACNFEYKTSATPVVTALGVLGARRADNETLNFVLEGMRVDREADGIRLTKLNNKADWNAGGYNDKFFYQDSNFNGISFRASRIGQNVMVGLNSGKNSHHGYQDLDYAFYLDQADLKIYEDGLYRMSLGRFSSSTVLQISYGAKCDCIQYFADGQLMFQSTRAVTWPLFIDFSFFTELSTIDELQVVTAAKKDESYFVVFGTLLGGADSSVTVNGTACSVFRSDVGRLFCSTKSKVSTSQGQSLNVQVNTQSYGSSAVQPLSLGAPAFVPTSTVGPLRGGSVVTLSGVQLSSGKVTVTIGGKPATILSQSDSVVTVLAPAQAGIQAYDIVMKINDQPVTCGINVCTYNATSTTTPDNQISDTAPRTIPAKNTPTKVSGKFNFTSRPQVLFSNNGVVMSAVTVTSYSDAEVSFASPSLAAGTYTMQIQSIDGGFANGQLEVTIPLTIQSVTPQVVGSGGGAIVTFTGNGFGNGNSTITIASVSNKNICKSIQVVSDSLICETLPGIVNDDVTVTVDGTPAAANFKALDSARPTVTSIVPSSGSRGDVVTLIGTSLAGNASDVRIGTATGVYLSSTDTNLVVILKGTSAPVTTSDVAVVTVNGGRATCSASFTFLLQIEKVQPVYGSKAGGTLLTIQGTGFGSDTSAVIVKVGDSLCSVQSVTDSKIICKTSPQVSDNGLAAAVSVEIASASSAPVLLNAPVKFSFEVARTGYVDDITPTSGSAGGGTYVTLTGRGFGIDPSDNEVFIGTERCPVTSVIGGTQLICVTKPQAPLKNASIRLAVKDQGGAAVTTSKGFDFELQVTSVVPPVGSVQGSTLITVKGFGFGDFTQNYTKVYVGYAPCTVISSTYNEVQCLTPPSSRSFDTPAQLVSAHEIRPAGGVNVSVVINGTLSIPCMSCFEYRAERTPTITSVTPNQGIVFYDQIIVIQGTGFTTDSVVRFGTEVCTTEGVPTSSEIRCRMNSINVGKQRITVTVPGWGVAHTRLSCPAGQFLTCDGTCITDSNCTYDAWGMTTCKDLFRVMVPDSFCQSNGGSDRVGKAFQSDVGTSLNFNCPMYDCEAQDCNASITVGGRGAVVSTCGADPNGYLLDYRPQITSVSPTQSSSMGGRNITFTGTNLGSLSSTAVMIGSAYCIPLEVSSTRLVCSTQRAPNGKALARLNVNGVAAVCSVCDFWYKDDLAAVVDNLNALGYNSKKRAIQGRGGALLTLVGSKFHTTLASNRILVGLKPCTPKSVNDTALICELPYLPAGDYSLSLNLIDRGDASFSSTFASSYGLTPLRYELEILQISVPNSLTVSGSVAGGTIIRIGASGMTSNVQVVFLGTPVYALTILNVTDTEVYAVARPASVWDNQGREIRLRDVSGDSICRPLDCRFKPDTKVSPTLLTVSPTALQSGATTTLTISVNTFGYSTPNVSVSVGANACDISTITPSPTVTTITCTVGNFQSAGKYRVNVLVSPFGYAKQSGDVNSEFPSLQYPLTVDSVSPASASIGGGGLITISGSGFSSVVANNFVQIGSVPCAVVSSNLTTITCTVAASPIGAFSSPVSVTVANPTWNTTNVTASSASNFEYSLTSTPFLNGDVTPFRATTAGGTEISFSGQRLSQVTKVTIDGVECVQTAGQKARSSDSLMYCTTGPHPVTIVTALRIFSASGEGIVTGGKFEYVDLWSRWTTWGGLPPPAAGESAVIAEGQLVVIDQSPPRLHLVIVMGHLRADDGQDMEFHCTYIMVNFGRLTVGTPEKPFRNKFTFTLYGDRLTPEIPVHGAKVIALRNGAIDFHGIPRNPTWTKLTKTAAINDRFLVVKGPVDWAAGEKIVVSSTDYDMEHAEERIISNVVNGENARIEFTEPLHYQHFGEIQCFDGNCVDERAAVGHFTRNIVVQGDSTSRRNGFGGTMFLMPLGQDKDRYARLSFVEFRDVGQQYIVGRYPVHFHVTGASSNSYCNGTSIYKSLNRAFSIHGVMNNTYVNNVGYDIAGHAMFIEDGSERWNVIKNNLMMVARASTSNLNTDLTPATFWIVSPSNWIEGNHGGGAGAYGFWIAPFHPMATGPSGGPTICPATHPLWFFERNTAHSNGKYGLNIFRFWWPKEKECDTSSKDVPAYIRDVTVFKNNIHGVTMGNQEAGQVGSIIVERLTSADNGKDHPDASAYWIEKNNALNMTCGIKDSVLIALTNNQPYRRSVARRGVNLPEGDNFFTENVTFINYNNENYGFEPQAWAHRLSLCFPYGWEAVSRGLKWINSPNRIRFRFDHHGILNDDDGTLAGLPGSQIIPAAPMFDPSKCVPVDPSIITLNAAVRCPSDAKVRRLGVSTESEIFASQLWTVNGRKEIVPVIMRKYIVTAPVSSNINISFQSWFNPQSWDWKWGSLRYNRPNETIVFWTRYNETRDRVVLNGVNASQSFPSLDDLSNPIPYKFDNETGMFGVALRFPNPSVNPTAFDCPETGCPGEFAEPPPERRPCTPWEMSSSWVSGKVPTDAAVVSRNDSVCVTYNSTVNGVLRLESLLVRGQIYFRCKAGETITINVNKWIFVRGGLFDIGSPTDIITSCKININIGKPLFTKQDTAARTLLPWGVRVFAFEYGEINIYGGAPSVAYTNLAETVKAGSSSLKLIKAVDWKSGQYLALSSSERVGMYSLDEETMPRAFQDEKVIVDSVSADGLTVTLKSPVKYTHYGSGKVIFNGREFYPGAEVAVLDRNVVLGGGHDEDEVAAQRLGWQFAVGCTLEGYDGCKKSKNGDDPWPMGPKKRGLINIRGAQFRNIGQSGRTALLGGIILDGLVTGTDGALGSSIQDSVVVNSYHTAISLSRLTTNMTLTNNIIFNVSGDGMLVTSTANSLDKNLVISVTRPIPQCVKVYDIFWDCRTAAYRTRRNNKLTNNIAASGGGSGYITEGDDCGSTNLWSNNIAHSFRDGVLVADEAGLFSKALNVFEARTDASCRQVTGVTTYFNNDHGIVAWYIQGNARYDDIASIDDMIGFTSLHLYNDELNENSAPQMNVTRAIFAGRWKTTDDCRKFSHSCRSTLAHTQFWCMYWTEDTDVTVGNVGIMQSSFVTTVVGRTMGEAKYIWHEPDSYTAIKGLAKFTDIYFDNFDGSDACQRKNVAVSQNQYSNDTFVQHSFSNVKWGPGMADDGEVYARTTYGKAKNPPGAKKQYYYLDFDNDKFGGFWPDAPNKFFIADADGTFTISPKRATVVNSRSLVSPSTFSKIGYDGKVFDNITALDPPRSECSFKKNWNAYICRDIKYVTIAVETLAEDRMTRRPGPVVLCRGDGAIAPNGWPLCQGGFVDISSGSVSHGKIHRATLDRPARYYFIAESGQNYTLSFRGQPPTWMRIWILGNEWLNEPAGVTLNVRYFGLNAQSRVGIYVNKKRLPPVVGFGAPETQRPPRQAPQPFDPAGTHYHDKYVNETYSRNVMTVTVRSDSYVDLKQEPVIQVQLNVAMSEDDFFNNKDTFALALAKVLGIDASRLKFANIVSGTKTFGKFHPLASSTQVTIEIDSGVSDIPDKSTATPAPTDASGTDAPTPAPTLAPNAINLTLVEQKLETIEQNPTTLTTETAKLGTTIPVSSVKAELDAVTVKRQPVTVAYGIPYILFNTTMGNFSSSDLQTGIISWIRDKYNTTIPFNTTDTNTFNTASCFTDEMGLSTCAFVFAFDSVSDNVFALQTLQSDFVFPLNYTDVKMEFYWNGVVLVPVGPGTAAPTSAPTPTDAPTVAPTVAPTTSAPATTLVPSTNAPTPAPTVPVTQAPTLPLTDAPTPAPTVPLTQAPTTAAPTLPVTQAPTTTLPVTQSPTSIPTASPTQAATSAPTTSAPTTSAPTTSAPTTSEPTSAPTSASTTAPTTSAPTSAATSAPTSTPTVTTAQPTLPATQSPTSIPTVSPTQPATLPATQAPANVTAAPISTLPPSTLPATAAPPATNSSVQNQTSAPTTTLPSTTPAPTQPVSTLPSPPSNSTQLPATTTAATPIPTIITPNTSSANPTATPVATKANNNTSSSNVTAMSAANMTSTESAGLSSGEIAGVSIGVIAFVIIVVVAGLLYRKRVRDRMIDVSSESKSLNAVLQSTYSGDIQTVEMISRAAQQPPHATFSDL